MGVLLLLEMANEGRAHLDQISERDRGVKMITSVWYDLGV